MNIKVKISMKEKKLGGRPKLASYQKRTKCFRVMFTENDYIYIQSKAEQAGLSVNEFCHQAAMDCQDRKSTRLNSSHPLSSRMPSSA